MAEREASEVNRQTFQVAYDSSPQTPPRNASTMDVQSLGPALMAFGKLIKEANTQINGKKSSVKVLVQSDFENKCFNITFDVVQSVLHQIASMFQSEGVKDAREILSDLGIILGPTGLGLLGYLKWKNKRAVAEVRESDQQGLVIIQLGDGNTARVTRNAYELSKNAKIRASVEGTLKPLGVDGIESISFEGEGHVSRVGYSKEEASTMVASFDIADRPEEIPEIKQDESVIAWLHVYSPVFDAKAPKWRFIYENERISADISQTRIGADAVARGGSFMNDLYKVRMIIDEHITPTGQKSLEYTIVDVIDFVPAPRQSGSDFKRDDETT